MSNVLLGIILGLWSGISMCLNLSGLGVRTPIITGLLTGLCIGDIGTGLQVGSVMLVNSIGFYTFGGATIPDYITGSIFGTIVGSRSANVESGIVVAQGIALLMTQMDVLGRSSTTVFQHLGDKALAENNIGKFETYTLLGTLPWILSRAIPVFLGIILIDNIVVLTDFANSVDWIRKGLACVGGALPAVGFALLLSYMDLKKMWPFFIVGFLLYSYANMGTLPLALVGLVAANFVLKQQEGGAQ
ncbi:MAG: PTS sugar transporter subunit IIC [Erysipelotrichia bacterium]|nr:PTS sugar transporter subunit IIC [Erysipelotrichia bacterium]